MTITFIILNLAAAAVAVAVVGALVALAHRLSETAPANDETWGASGTIVPSDPLPLRQVARHADDRQSALAA